MRTDSFSVELDKITKDRPRVTRRGHAFTPKATVDAEKKIAHEWLLRCGGYGGFDCEQPLSMTVRAFIQIPKSRLKGKNKVESGSYHTERRGDVDNIGKLVMDALNGHAYNDDSQISRLIVIKRWQIAPTFLQIDISEMHDD